MSSNHPVPVVRLILEDSQGRVLLLRRANTAYGLGQWCLPGGKVDYADTLERTAAKELAEETELVCTGAEFLFFQESLPLAAGGMHCINFYFRCTFTGQPRLNGESSQLAWIGPHDMKGYDIAFRNDVGLERYWGAGR